MYHYAGNNPVRYIDPDGKIAIPLAVFAVIVVELYLLTPSGQQGIQAAGEILSYGIISANQAVSNAITVVKTAVNKK